MPLAIITLLIGMASVQFGASMAKGLFPVLGPTGATTWRLLIAALILVVVWRPWRQRITRQELRLILPYGLALGFMNVTFYLALARIPLGIAVALEFTGPLSVAIFTSRRPRDFIWAALAGIGLFMLFPTTDSQLDPFGIAMALAAGGCWAGYIIYGQKAGAALNGGRAAALGMVVAMLVALPVGLVDRGLGLWQPSVMWIALLVGIFSSAIPYSLEMIALKRLRANTFSILMSLEPAIATLMGWLFLKEILGPLELLAVGCIIAASLGSALTSQKSRPA